MVGGYAPGIVSFAAMGPWWLVECPDPVGSEFKTCFEEAKKNLGLETENQRWLNMIIRISVAGTPKFVSTAIMSQKESGGNLAEVPIRRLM